MFTSNMAVISSSKVVGTMAGFMLFPGASSVFSKMHKILLTPRFSGLFNWQPFASYKLKPLVERLGLPEKPKRPVTAYGLFVQKSVPDIKKNDPNITMNDVLKVIAEQWRTISPKQLQELKDIASQERKKFNEELAKYEAKLTGEDRAKILEAVTFQKELKKKQQLKRKLKELGMPKRPGNAYLLYMKDYLSKNPGHSSVIKANLLISKQWSTLPQEEKDKWHKVFEEKQKKYNEMLKQWETTMIKEGKLEVTYDALLERKRKSLRLEPKLSGK